jgi:hypothetical protein
MLEIYMRIPVLLALLIVTTLSASAATVTWSGAGADDKWSTAANWTGGAVPGAADAVVIDGTSAKDSRWDGEQHIASLTVLPTFKGQLIFAGFGEINGDVVLSGRLHHARDMHHWIWMRGTRIDLSRVTAWTQSSRYSGGIDLGGTDAAVVQHFTAPSMQIGDLRLYEKGTVIFTGPVLASLVEAGGEKTVDFNHQNLTARSLGCAAQVKNLGGVTITLTSWAGWSPFAFGRSKSFMSDKPSVIDLAPDKPWKLVVKTDEIEAYSDVAKRQPFAFINCRVGNCDASGGTVVIATDRCEDLGGNRNVTFK